MTDQRHETRRPDPDLLRAEAERLVAAGLAAVSVAADRIGAPTRERGGAAAAGFDALGDMLFGPSTHRRHSVANGSPECCLCPVCRVIAAARQPTPAFADRLATGVGAVAGGAARMFRGVAGAADAVREHRDATPAGDPGPWTAATTSPTTATTPSTAATSAPTSATATPTTATVTVAPADRPTAEDEPDPWAAATAMGSAATETIATETAEPAATATETAEPAATVERPDTTGPADR